MAKRLDPDIRALAEMMQERREEAKGRMAAGEIQHFKFMDIDTVATGFRDNVAHVLMNEEPQKHLADLANYGLALIQKQ